MTDLRFAIRQLTRSPGFTATILLTLALGLGANTEIFSVINTTYLRALPYPEPDRLMHVSESNAQWSDMSVSLPNFLDWQAQQDVFASLAIYHTDGRKIQTPDGVEQVALGHVSGDFFRVLGARVRSARELTIEDDRVGAAPVTWLTHEAWQRYYSGDSDLVGRTIRIDGQPVTVAGVLAADFRFFRRVDVLVPLAPYAEYMFMKLVGLGAVLGLAGAWAGNRLLQSQLYGVGGDDPLTYGAGAAVLLLAAALACILPAQRATRVDPLTALRVE